MHTDHSRLRKSFLARPLWSLIFWLLGMLAALRVLEIVLPLVTTPVLLLVWSAVWGVLWWLLFWRRRLWRQMAVQAVVKRDSPWRRRLARGWLLAPGQGLVAAGFSVALLLALTRGLPASTWLLMIVLVPLWACGWIRWQLALADDLHTTYTRAVVGQLLHWTLGCLLLCVLTVLALWQDLPDLRSASLLQAMAYYSRQYQVESEVLSALMIAVSTLEGAYHWLVQQADVVEHGGAVTLVAWLFLLMREALFVWPWLYLCQGLALLHGWYAGGYGVGYEVGYEGRRKHDHAKR